jgi:hypothetical protein
MTQKEPPISNSKIFIMTYVGILDTCLGVTLVYFHNDKSGYFIRKITYPMSIMIRDSN